jgi:hypothetical protein
MPNFVLRETTFMSVSPAAGKYQKLVTIMKTRKSFIPLTMMAIGLLLISSGCEKETTPTPTKTTSYDLMVKDVLGVSGSVTITEINENSATIDLVLVNAPEGTHPANLYRNSAIENGLVELALNPVDATGKSTTLITSMNFSELIAYDGHIKVLSSVLNPFTIVAQADIGGNLITATKKSYSLNTIGEFGVSGTALFEKRLNGNTLLTISLDGVLAGDSYPATINLGTVESVGGGPSVKSLSSVNGTSGKSYTNIQELDGGTAISYEDWMVYDGYINVYQSSVALENIISQGNIGSN